MSVVDGREVIQNYYTKKIRPVISELSFNNSPLHEHHGIMTQTDRAYIPKLSRVSLG